MKAVRFRVQNFRNIDDSGWIELDKVTAFVGRNESGKTALLKALHKFNPATQESYDAQREFPRDRYTRDYDESRGGDWPVCSVEFEISEEVLSSIANILHNDECLPQTVTLTRYYDHSLKIDRFSPSIQSLILPIPLVKVIDEFIASPSFLDSSNIDSDDMKSRHDELIGWAKEWRNKLDVVTDLYNEEGIELLMELQNDIEDQSDSRIFDISKLLEATELILESAHQYPIKDIENTLRNELPVMIYFENYGILDSSIWLSRFMEDLNNYPDNPRIRTISAMFEHTRLDPQEIRLLGEESDAKSIEKRTIKLNSASNDISRRFSEWWSQRRHKFRYQADGDYFRIWVADDVRPDLEIELEARSKGFQWFFSFYLVFLVESEGFYKDAILLLDEPGLHLHPTAQQELIPFLEKLSERNQLVYTTHSPFLIDGENLHRVRPVTEDKTGHSRITAEIWPKDRDTIFPLQAAAGYAMMRSLFKHYKNVLVEGMTDYYYLQELSQQCARLNRAILPDDIYIVPCGGTKYVGLIAALFMGEQVRPLVLLDGDEAGRARQNALLRDLYSGHESDILMLDDILHRTGQEVEIEDILGEKVVLESLATILGKDLSLDQEDNLSLSLPKRIKSAAQSQNIDLPEGWKATVALHIVSQLSKDQITLSEDTLNAAATLFETMRNRFDK